MRCEECEQILLDSKNCSTHKEWIPGVSVLNLAKLHAEGCPACAGKMSEILKVNDLLEQMRSSTSQNKAPAAVETNLLVEFRRRRARQVRIIPKNLRWRLLWASVAALTFFFGFMRYSQLSPTSTGVKTVKVEPNARQFLLPPPKTHEGLDRELTQDDLARIEGTGSRNTRMRARKLTHKKVREEPSFPVSGEFFLNGGGNIVRVSIPLASLAAMGLPMYPDAADRRVTADVARDPFGAVVAVRLIEASSGTN